MPAKDPRPTGTPETPDDAFELDDRPTPPTLRPSPVGPRAAPPPVVPVAPVDDDDDYELEAPDESIEQLARQRTKEELEQANVALEIDQAQRDMETRNTLDGDLDFKFQFQIKHMLIATTALSLVFALRELLNISGLGIVMVLVTLGLIGVHTYLDRQEQRRLDEASARRAEAIRRARERDNARARGETTTIYDRDIEEADTEFEEAIQDNRFRPSFSTRDLLIAMTVAAVIMGLGVAFNPQALALLLGMVAVSGLAAYGLGMDPPPAVVTAWWVTVGMYILMGIARVTGLIGGAA